LRRCSPPAEEKVYRELNRRAMKEKQQFERGVAHFNAREFFEAHEIWEELWLRTPEPDKTFLQGLIQIAAAFHHYGRGNVRGTKSLLAAGVAKLGGFPGNHRGIALVALRTEAQEWMEILEAQKGPRPERLPQILPATLGGSKKNRIPKKATAKKKRGG
jgi:predicted metal-dependent hydrolase